MMRSLWRLIRGPYYGRDRVEREAGLLVGTAIILGLLLWALAEYMASQRPPEDPKTERETCPAVFLYEE